MILRLRMPLGALVIGFLLVLQALVFGARSLAETYRIGLHYTDQEWNFLAERVAQGDELIFEMDWGRDQRFVLGPSLGRGTYGRVFRLASPQNQILKLNLAIERPGGGPGSFFQRVVQRFTPEVPLGEREATVNSFENEAFHLSKLDGTGIHHPRVLSNIRNMAMVKEYVDGRLFGDFFGAWRYHSLQEQLDAVKRVVELVRILEARSIHIEDPGPTNLMFHRGTMDPYVIDPGPVRIDERGRDAVPGTYANQVIENGVYWQFPKNAVWVGLLEPTSLDAFLRIGQLIDAGEVPRNELLESLLGRISLMNPEHDLRPDLSVEPILGEAALRLKKAEIRNEVAREMGRRFRDSGVMAEWRQRECSQLLTR